LIDTDKGEVILRGKNDMDFEFIDTAIESFVKKMITTEDEELVVSKNRFTEAMI